LICFSCNVHKGAQQTGIDPTIGEIGALFHPLHERWDEHFSWDESRTLIIGLTACGRAMIEVMEMNNPTVVRARRRWVSAGWHPPVPESPE